MIRTTAFVAACLFLLSPAFADAQAMSPAGMTVGFVSGADISALAVVEARGAVFRGETGPVDGLKQLRSAGFDCFRLRLFVAPDHQGIVTNDLEYTLALARRVKASGARFMLDLHYSDTWADPAKQFKPAAWEKLPFDELVGAVREYTRLTLARFIAEGLTPEYVQIGNEITNGLLWPDGRVEFREAHDFEAWVRLARVLRAGFEGFEAAVVSAKIPRPKTIVHIESTGDVARTSWWLKHASDAGLPFDIVGLSYYPEWHGGIASLRETLTAVAEGFKKPVMVVETAYPWKLDSHWEGKKNLDWPLTPDGQKQFLSEVNQAVRDLPDGLGAGVCWWHPESVEVQGLQAWLGGSCALFDGAGALLPAAKIFCTTPAR
ncbi:arabinogalactan endo-1,4-beta-galactosidase [Nibricoccus aquaticus]|uniref:Arabinogalactan endo-beta-1,4-galactanase n=1 Tax=Nibricoccus aquaticus TaxID=2576891 RepID=A0A290QBY3_9BACT|nr:glycosyl hydrolase 53 family protein [Nibricoccus aquaticus]ATC66034.1 arabinogalactan endo-1,4-beta-galactosidase [Nibricoccus aquaticus]